MRYFVTGGAGFIGSHLVDRLLRNKHEVWVYDNLSTGKTEFLSPAREQPGFHMVQGDLLDSRNLSAAMRHCQAVFHLAANADVRYGTHHPEKDLEQNIVATFRVLEAMRAAGITKIAFSSTGSVYGEPEIFPTPEGAPFPKQTSFYGASKLACEGLIEAYCEGFGFQSWIFRLVSVLGERYTHGHVSDFFKQLVDHPHRLHVLGDGHQKKSYLYVQDCIDAMLLAFEKAGEKVNIFNLGREDSSEVNDSVRWITQHLGVSPQVTYSGGRRGWIGDSPLILPDCSRIRALGWKPKVSIRDGVLKTLDFLRANQPLLEKK
jgi:UDP-glucose 4-epimerase